MRNLIKRGNVYHVTKDVPKALRAIAGVPRLQDTLNTTDLAVADRSKHSFLAGYERRLRAWRAQSQGLPATVDPIMERAALAGEYARENPDDENVELGAELLAEEVLHPGIRSYNTEPDENGREVFAPGVEAHAYEVQRVASGEPLLTKLLDRWLASHPIKPATKARYKRAVTRFLAWSKARFAVDVTKRQAHEYGTIQLRKHYTKRETIAAEINGLSAFWQFLTSGDYAEANPWPGQRPKRGVHADEDAHWLRFENEELGRILGAMPEGEALGDAVRIAALMGFRREEVISLCVVEERHGLVCLNIAEGLGKTVNAPRCLPVPDALLPIIERRRKLTAGLFSDLTAKKPGDALGKRFSRIVRSELRILDKLKVFHSLRKWHRTELEQTGTTRDTAEFIQGRSRGGGTDLYSSGPLLVQIKEALERVKLPAEVLVKVPA